MSACHITEQPVQHGKLVAIMSARRTLEKNAEQITQLIREKTQCPSGFDAEVAAKLALQSCHQAYLQPTSWSTVIIAAENAELTAKQYVKLSEWILEVNIEWSPMITDAQKECEKLTALIAAHDSGCIEQMASIDEHRVKCDKLTKWLKWSINHCAELSELSELADFASQQYVYLANNLYDGWIEQSIM